MDDRYLTNLAVQGTPKLRDEKSSYLRRSLTNRSANKSESSFAGMKSKIDVSYTSPRPQFGFETTYGSVNGSINALSTAFQSQFMDTAEDTGVSTLIIGDDYENVQVSNLFQEFLDFYLSYPGEHEIFDLLFQYEEICSNCSSHLVNLVAKAAPSQQRVRSQDAMIKELQHERNTWRLVRTLYKDRIEVIDLNEDEMLMNTMGQRLSDKQIIENLFLRNSFVRQCQLIVDWLEKNAADDFPQMYSDKMEYFSDQSFPWEHTLHNLVKQRTPLDKPTRDSLITELDPDAPIRQRNNILHASDKEDEARLLKFMFVNMRAGNLNEAQRMAEKFGHPWMAASLEGWRLFHDPNYDDKGLVEGESLKPIEGNKYRDIWKVACWRMSEEPRISTYQQALYGCLSGNLKAIFPACLNWDDYLWAYMRVLVDRLMEQELRTNTQCERPLEELPPEYSDKILDIEQIFQDIQACPVEAVKKGQGNHQIIQKFVILGDVDGLIEQMFAWSQQKDPRPSAHLLRIMSHLILFFRVIGQATKEEFCVAILEAYVKELIEQRKIPLVAFYTATLPPTHQIIWYAKFLEGITDSSERQLCLKYAEEAGLDVMTVTKAVVENMRTRVVPETPEPTGISRTATTEEDWKKIGAIDWLVYDQIQRAEAMNQANALMRMFVANEKHDAAREVFTKVPVDSITVMMKQAQQVGREEMKAEDENAVREYLCFKAYLEALDAFNDWTRHFQHSKPRPPEPPAGGNVKFKEKIAYEHEMQKYELELERWENALMAQTKTTTDRLYNVLLFVSGGWMIDQRTEGVIDECRQKQMSLLRKLCIPQITKLLHNVLCSTHQYKESVQLADIIASERHQLYKEFNIQGLQQLLSTLRESSLALLGQNKDPLGYSYE